VTQSPSFGQRSRGRDRQEATVAARLHINPNGTISVMTGKVEEGQGARAELTQAAAEELRVTVDRIQLIMADTALVPNDGITAGSRTTPINVPAVRRGAATALFLVEAVGASASLQRIEFHPLPWQRWCLGGRLRRRRSHETRHRAADTAAGQQDDGSPHQAPPRTGHNCIARRFHDALPFGGELGSVQGAARRASKHLPD